MGYSYRGLGMFDHEAPGFGDQGPEDHHWSVDHKSTPWSDWIEITEYDDDFQPVAAIKLPNAVARQIAETILDNVTAPPTTTVDDAQEVLF